MSHTVQTRSVQITCESIFRQSCNRLGFPVLGQGEHELFDTPRVGFGVQLPDWNLPIVVDFQTGAVAFDNYGGQWGDISHLDRLIQRYAADVSVASAQEQGFQVEELELEDGELLLTCNSFGGDS